MLLNLGLTADAAAAHTPDPSVHPETPPAQSSSSYCSALSLATLPLLGSLYNRSKQLDALPSSPNSILGVAMNPTPKPKEAESALPRPRVGRSNTATTRKASRSKTSYQLAHPAAHARHKRLKLRPKLLLQLQQVTHTPRPLPILDILPSTLFVPRLARKFPTVFRGRNGLGPNDLIIVTSELYERRVGKIPETSTSADDDDEDQREVVATICQILQGDALQKGKAEICLNFGPVWEATPLPSGSYEFVTRTENGIKVMRWALRAGRNRRYSAQPSSEPREDTKRFTFSVIDPNTRRHPVIASLTRNQLEVYDEYSAVTRSNTGPTTPSSGMSVISDLSDNEGPEELYTNTNANAKVYTLDDELRTMIIVTGIWVAFREGWSDNFSYGDPIASPTKSVASPTSSKSGTPIGAKSENNSPERDELNELKDVVSSGKRVVSMSSMRRANTMSPLDGLKSFGSLSKRSNSTGATFMERAKQRNASASSSRPNRHSMFTGTGENGRDIVVSRPASLRQNSVEPQDALPVQPKNKSKVNPTPENASQTLPSYSDHRQIWDTEDLKEPELLSPNPGKSKRRHRFSSLFTIFHRKTPAH
ncbi:hypothetical protein N7540_010874 [Penicillium herquei]|nr:hypothetical protein N7540_010874 [Penicillium herquei]